MDYIKSWAAGLITVLLITAMLKFIIPPGSVKKTANIVMCIIILCVLIGFAGKIRSDEIELPDYNFGTQTIQSESTLYNRAIEDAVKDALVKSGIDCNSVNVISQPDAEGYIEIISVDISLADIDEAAEALDAIEDNTGIEKGVITIHDGLS